jgi:thiamine-phosphate pyrophosphorylase
MRSDGAAALGGLYAVTPETADTDALVRAVEACLRGGARLVQYRAKGAPPALALAQAGRLADACRRQGVPLIVNDSIDLALAAKASGVHVGREDASVAAARSAFPRGIVGVSCYDDLARAAAAGASGADYIGIGSMFASPTKPGAVRAPLDLIARAREASGLPVAAIGGIDAGNAAAVIAAGADMVAVISALFDAPDPERAARDIARLFNERPNGAQDVRAQPRVV